MKTKYIWSFTAVSQIEDKWGCKPTMMDYIISNANCSETVSRQIIKGIGEDYRITELSLQCENPIEAL